MESPSPGLQAWTQKLEELVGLAGVLRAGEHKAAAEVWFTALRQIQTLWSGPAQLAKESPSAARPRKTAKTTGNAKTGKGGARCSGARPGRKRPRDDTRPEGSLEETVKQEPEESTFDLTPVKEEQPEGAEGEVTSVHLMISADPVLVPDMAKYKKLTKTKDAQYQCDKCHKECRSAMALYKHRATHTKGLECQICHQVLSNRHALTAHQRIHSGERPYECPKCGARFTTRGNLVRHVASHDGERPWQCAVCGKRYTEKKSLKVHMRTHTGERPYACSVCGKRFAQASILAAHMLIHTNQFSHLCDICGRSFRQRSQLVTHHLRHEGVRPHPCSECDRKFTTKGDLDRHMRTHTGERPYQCDVCGSSFARPQTLQEHKNRHFNHKPFVCKVCGKGFHEHAACSRHVKSQHARDASADNIVRIHAHTHQGEAVEEEGEEEEGEEEEDEEGMEGTKEDGDSKHQIFVMQTGDTEETKLITIAEGETLVGGGGCVACEACGVVMASLSHLKTHAAQCKAPQVRVAVAEWLVHGDTGSPGDSMEITVGASGAEEVTVGADGGGEESLVDEETELDCMEGSAGLVEEVDGAELSHAVTISEDGSITSVPLSQLAPLHLQLESDYMVVLGNGARGQDHQHFQTQLHQVDETGLASTDDEQPRITLVSSLLTQ